MKICLYFLIVLAFPKASRTGLHRTSCSSRLLPSVLLLSTPQIEAKYWITGQGRGSSDVYTAIYFTPFLHFMRFYIKKGNYYLKSIILLKNITLHYQEFIWDNAWTNFLIYSILRVEQKILNDTFFGVFCFSSTGFSGDKDRLILPLLDHGLVRFVSNGVDMRGHLRTPDLRCWFSNYGIMHKIILAEVTQQCCFLSGA